MKELTPMFKDDTDKIIVVAILIMSLFFLFIPSLAVMLFAKKYVSDNSYSIVKANFNFELLLFIISLFFAVPIIGWLLGAICLPIIAIFNFIIILLNLCSVSQMKAVKIPVWFEFV